MSYRLLASLNMGVGFTLGCAIFSGSLAQAADKGEKAPATVAEAKAAFDLSALPLLKGAEAPGERRVARLGYQAKGKVKEAFAFHQAQLTGQGWKELPNSYVTDESASATFARDGYTLSLMAYPNGNDGKVSININNHGNVDLKALPVPDGVKPFYGGPVSTAFITEAPVKATADAVRTLLVAQGWEPYGSAGDVAFYKQNAIRLSARVMSAPAQGNKTVIDYSAELMSADLPPPPDIIDLRYAETQLFFDCKASQADVFAHYRKALADDGWKATTDAPIKDSFKNVLIYRNPASDMLTQEVQTFEGHSRCQLRFQSAAEVAELEKRFDAKRNKAKMDREKPKATPRLAIVIPAGATEVKVDKARVEFKLATGKARSTIEAFRASLKKEGWKEDVAALEDLAGTVSLSKGDQSLTLVYTDTGFLPSEVTVQASGVELEQSEPK